MGSPLTHADKKVLSDIMSVAKYDPSIITMDLAQKLYSIASNYLYLYLEDELADMIDSPKDINLDILQVSDLATCALKEM